MTAFTRWLPNLGDGPVHKNDDDDVDPIPGLIKLYACDNAAMQELSVCRINANLRVNQRRDLEFYIP